MFFEQNRGRETRFTKLRNDMHTFNELIKIYWPIAIVVLSLLGWVVTAWLSTKFATKKEMTGLRTDVEGIETTLEKYGQDILGIKKDIEHLPNAEQFSQLRVQIGKLETQSKTNGDMLKTIHDALIGAEGKKS